MFAIEHSWGFLPEQNDEFESRGCPVCGLIDRRRKDGEWKVDWGCIESVIDTVGFEQLLTELEAHPVNVSLRYGGMRSKSFHGNVLCHGVPGAWTIGLSKGDGHPFTFASVRLIEGELVIWPSYASGLSHFSTIGEGFSVLLRDMRARGYDPYKHSNYEYMKQLSRHHCTAECD